MGADECAEIKNHTLKPKLMAREIMLSRYFLKGHPREGERTEFENNILISKITTIRNGHRHKKGDFVSLKYWSEKAYRSPKVRIVQKDVEIIGTYDIDIYPGHQVFISGVYYGDCDDENFKILAKNDGLSALDLKAWFKELPFFGQIICFENIDYLKALTPRE